MSTKRKALSIREVWDLEPLAGYRRGKGRKIPRVIKSSPAGRSPEYPS